MRKILLKKAGQIFSALVNDEEIGVNEIKLSLFHADIKLDFSAFGQDYHDALWNLHDKLEGKNIELICNGLSLNIYPSAMQFDMGLAYQAMYLKMGINATNSHIVDVLDVDENVFIKCTRTEQFDFYNKWLLSNRK